MTGICMFFPIFPPRYGGGTIQAITLAKELRSRGVDIFFVALTDDPSQRGEAIFEGFEVHFVQIADLDVYIESRSSIPEKLKLLLKIYSKMYSLRKRYSILHIQGLAYPYSSLSILAGLLGKRSIAKVSMLQEVAFSDCGRLFGRMSRLSARRLDRLVAISSMIRRAAVDSGIDGSMVEFVPNAVDVEKYFPLPGPERAALKSSLGITGKPVVTFVGAITYRKGVDGLVSLWPDIAAGFPDSVLVLIGPRSEEEGVSGDRFCFEEATGMVREHNMESRVLFKGRVDNVAEYLQVSDLFVFPSTMEGMPNVVLEAMACGVPAIAYRVSGVEDVIEDGENGLLLDVGDTEGFRSAVSQLLGSGDKRGLFGKNALETIRGGFTYREIADRYIEIYRSLEKY